MTRLVYGSAMAGLAVTMPSPLAFVLGLVVGWLLGTGIVWVVLRTHGLARWED